MDDNPNPFAELWDELKGRGRRSSGKGKSTRYIVHLSEGEMASLVLMRNLYEGVDSVIEEVEVTGPEIKFRLPDAIRLAKKSYLKSKK